MDGELAYTICTFNLYFTDLEAEDLQTATGSELVWPSIIGTRRRRHNAYASERSLTKFIDDTHHPATANYFVDRKFGYIKCTRQLSGKCGPT